MRRLFVSLLPLFFLLSLVLSPVFVSSAAQCDSNSVKCEACSTKGDGQRVNDMAGIPRVDAKFKPVSNDLGSFDWYTCDAQGLNCKTFSPSVNIDSVTNGGTSPRDPINYAVSVLVYVVFGIVMMIVVVLVGICLCTCRYCCCCCGKLAVKGGCCGGRWPTIKTKYFGVVMNPDTKEYEYPVNARWAARIFMWIFVLFMLIWIGLGYFSGTKKIPEALKSVANSPQPLVSRVQSTEAAFANVIVNVASMTLVGALQNTSRVINQAVNLTWVVEKVDCSRTAINNLPSLDNAKSFLTSVERTVRDVASILDSIVPSLQGSVNAQTGSVDRYLSLVNGNFTEIQGSLNSTRSALGSALGTLDTLDELTRNITQRTNRITSDLNSIDNLPTTTQTNQAGSDANAVLTTGTPALASGTVTALKGSLGTVQTRLGATADFSATGDNMDQFNSDADRAVSLQLPDNALRSLDQASQSQRSITGYINAINQTLNDLNNVALTFNLDVGKDLIAQINRTVNQIPSFDGLLADIDRVLAVKVGIDCLATLPTRIKDINNTLILLPSSANSVDSILNSINTTLNDAVVAANDVKRQIADFEKRRVDLTNFTTYLNQIDSTVTLVRAQTRLLNNDALLSDYLNIVNSNSINFTSIRASILALNSSLSSNPRLNSSTISQVRSYGPPINSLRSTVNSYMTDLLVVETTGACSNAPTQSCVNNGDCPPSGTCSGAPVRRCSNSQTICQADSACPGGYCMTGDERTTALRAALSSYGTFYPQVYPSTELRSAIDSITRGLNSSTASLQTGPIRSQISTAQSSLTLADPASFADTLNRASRSLYTFNVSDYVGSVNIANNTVNSIRFSDFYSRLDSLNNSYQSVLKERVKLDQVRAGIDTIDRFIGVELNTNYAPRLSKPVLQQRVQTSGVAGAILAIAEIVDDMNKFLVVNSRSAGGNGLDFNISAVANTDQIRDFTNRVYGPQNVGNGGLYYFMQLVNSGGSLNADDPLANRYDADINGNPYLGGKKCYAKKCIDATIDYYESKPVSYFAPVGISMTPIELNGLLYLIPTFLALLGLAASLMYFSYKAANWMSSLTACCVFSWLPLLFFISTILFVLLIIFSDMCNGAVNIGNQALRAQEPSLCKTQGGIGSGSNCVFTTNGVNVTVNMLGFYQNVIGGCSASQPDYIQQVYDSLRVNINDWPERQMRSQLDSSFPPTQDYSLRPSLRQVFVDAAGTASPIAQQFITDFSGVTNCNALHSTFSDTKDAFCCDLGGAIYWALASWYLISWTLWFCGCPAALFGRKRFSERLGDVPVKHIYEYLDYTGRGDEIPNPLAVDSDYPKYEEQGEMIVHSAPLISVAPYHGGVQDAPPPYSPEGELEMAPQSRPIQYEPPVELKQNPEFQTADGRYQPNPVFDYPDSEGGMSGEEPPPPPDEGYSQHTQIPIDSTGEGEQY